VQDVVTRIAHDEVIIAAGLLRRHLAVVDADVGDRRGDEAAAGDLPAQAQRARHVSRNRRAAEIDSGCEQRGRRITGAAAAWHNSFNISR